MAAKRARNALSDRPSRQGGDRVHGVEEALSVVVATGQIQGIAQIRKDRLGFAAGPQLYEREVGGCEVHFPPKPLELSRHAVFARLFAGGCVLFFDNFPQGLPIPSGQFLFAPAVLPQVAQHLVLVIEREDVVVIGNPLG